MTKKKVERTAERAFVVDTSVGRACGNAGSKATEGTRCRQALETIRLRKMRAVTYPALLEEYGRQDKQSRFFLLWLRTMRSQRRVLHLAKTPTSALGEALDAKFTVKEQRALTKDVHLADAALDTDRRVLSLDDKVRELFRQLAGAQRPLRQVHWANPKEDGCVAWLHRRAPDDKPRTLGHRP